MGIDTGYNSWDYQSVYESLLAHKGYTRRCIGKTGHFDKISIYPFLPTEVTATDLLYDSGDITTTIITNPLYTNEFMKPNSCLMSEYKSHAVVHFAFKTGEYPENHQRNIKKCLKAGLTTEVVGHITPEIEEEFYDTYKVLISRHNIAPDAPTHYSFEQIRELLRVNGTVLLKTQDQDGGLCGYALFYIDRNDAYYHIGCNTELGYKLNSNFLMMHTAIQFFKRLGLMQLEIGASPLNSQSDGLVRFKKGFANMEKTNHIIKIIHQPEVYNELCKGIPKSDYFPLYRSPAT